MPAGITIFRGPPRALVRDGGPHDAEELVDEIAATVVHVVAHHFGIDDHRLDELGW
jgi:predicted Zn-dependent protease with MMP-like domain